MDAIKSWALTVCIACICIGVLQQFTSNRTNFSVIKLILTLYILITAFSPLNNIKNVDMSFKYNLPQPEETIINTQELIIQEVQQNINSSLVSAVAAQNNYVHDIKTDLALTGDYIDVTNVKIYISENTDVENAKQTVLQALNTNVPIEIISGG